MQNDERSLDEQIRAASAKERELWACVKGFYPGGPGHDPALWREWMQAAERVRDLAEMIRNSLKD